VQAAGIPCSAIPLADIELRFQQDPKVTRNACLEQCRQQAFPALLYLSQT
jgi:hypothetical protein